MYQIIYQIKAYDKTKTVVKNPIMINAFVKEILRFKKVEGRTDTVYNKLIFGDTFEYYFSLFEEPFKYFLSVCCCSCSCNQVGLHQIRIFDQSSLIINAIVFILLANY